MKTMFPVERVMVDPVVTVPVVARERAGKALTGRGALVDGQLLMNGATRV